MEGKAGMKTISDQKLEVVVLQGFCFLCQLCNLMENEDLTS